ncbi:hypothetical protein [Burkholderia ubonensis]|uniref:hypothetical protein n=1 Tax=Burkholderia ubonensis TaxID=101571 RepID=UPI000B1A23B9|nr:hypothetical protein [Burkholderia ubonensis]
MREPGIMIPGHPTDTTIHQASYEALFPIGLCLSTSSAFAARPQVADEPGAGKDFCTPGESMPNASGSSLTLCVKKGHFAHDQYEVKVDGAVVVKGIDDETTGGVNGSYGGRPVNLTCTPVLSAPEEVTESQIESMRSMDPQATREQLKQRYLSLNTVETARHCVVRVDSRNVLSTDIHFE